jgi:hypothetical protein
VFALLACENIATSGAFVTTNAIAVQQQRLLF